MALQKEPAQNIFHVKGDTFSMTEVLKEAALYDFKCGAEDHRLREDLGLKTYVGTDGSAKVQEPIVAGTASRKPENRSAAGVEKMKVGGGPPLASDRGSSTMSTASEVATDEGIDFESTNDCSSEAEEKSKSILNVEDTTQVSSSPFMVQYSEEREYSNDVRFLALLDALLPCIESD